MDDYNGLYKTNPKLSIAMMLAMFSLAGIPPFAGFFSKFFIFYAAAEQGFYILVLIALINTVISLYILLFLKCSMVNTGSVIREYQIQCKRYNIHPPYIFHLSRYRISLIFPTKGHIINIIGGQ
jgi:formate hydrogenlyase subunit 3/multisubunit Na+/H+ antiporter MnhD subunit